MSGYIKLNKSIFTSAKFKQLRALTKIGTEHLLGVLARLWMIADDQSEMIGSPQEDVYRDAIIAGWTPELLDAEMGVEGFASALAHRSVGWARFTRSGMVLPEFEKHNDSAKQRAHAASRMRRWRERNGGVTRNNASSLGDASVTRNERPQTRPTRPDQPDQTNQPPTRTEQNRTDQPDQTSQDIAPHDTEAPPAAAGGLAGAESSGFAVLAGGWSGAPSDSGTSFDKRRCLIELGIAEPTLSDLHDDPRVTRKIVRDVKRQMQKPGKKLDRPGAWAVSAIRAEIERHVAAGGAA